MSNISVGSICSGIEAASVALSGLGYEFKWFSEIADFPSKFLNIKYPHIPNLGDMCDIPKKLKNREVDYPDLICGGTPCQAFSFAGLKRGLEDSRGNLTLKFVDIINENDRAREQSGLPPTIVLWENVEGVIKDKTNAFGSFLSILAGLESEISATRLPQAGFIHGPTRNIAWRILDAKYFGLPQQRRRLYLLAGGKDFYPENILFESANHSEVNAFEERRPLIFSKNGHSIELFRHFTDCLYSAYGTKWNGNAAAYNGSLFVVQNNRLRRFTPLECERLMGFPDDYTNIAGVKPTNRYQGIGNSWAIPVIKWIGNRIKAESPSMKKSNVFSAGTFDFDNANISESFKLYDLSDKSKNKSFLNSSEKPNEILEFNLHDVIDVDAPENFYISPVGCKGILRRTEERQKNINPRLKAVLHEISSMWSQEEIEVKSRRQKRGRFSLDLTESALINKIHEEVLEDLPLFKLQSL